ncbi:hypothetical protein N9Z53_00130 [Mariniblastus sp.]|nr:hypothetical protein [Mariniblastus sp.]
MAEDPLLRYIASCAGIRCNEIAHQDQFDGTDARRRASGLYTEIYSPRDQTEDLPIVFLRTPYRVADPAGGFTRYFGSTFRELVLKFKGPTSQSTTSGHLLKLMGPVESPNSHDSKSSSQCLKN